MLLLLLYGKFSHHSPWFYVEGEYLGVTLSGGSPMNCVCVCGVGVTVYMTIAFFDSAKFVPTYGQDVMEYLCIDFLVSPNGRASYCMINGSFIIIMFRSQNVVMCSFHTVIYIGRARLPNRWPSKNRRAVFILSTRLARIDWMECFFLFHLNRRRGQWPIGGSVKAHAQSVANGMLKGDFSVSLEQSNMCHTMIRHWWLHSKQIKLDDSAFLRTQSYITEICYFEYLPSLLFGSQKPFSPQFRAI